MTPTRFRFRTRGAIDPRTGKHIAAPDTLWWACTWIAAGVLSIPLFAWAAYTFWQGEFYLPRSRHVWFRGNWTTLTGTTAAMLSTAVLLSGVAMFLRAGVREIDRLRPIVDRAERPLITVCLLLVIGAAILGIVQVR